MKRRGWCRLGCLLVAGMVAAHGQVVRLAGGVSSLTAGQGATAGVYEADRTSQIGFGLNEGFHFSASREVHVGNATMLAGDTSIALRLPTDLQDGSRALNVRGFMLRSEDAHNRTQVFLGMTGSMNGNAYFTSMQSPRAVGVFSTEHRIGRVEISALNVTGEHSSSLASVAFRPTAASLIAVTSGLSAGSPIFRIAAHHGTGNDQLNVSYTAGALKLQPEPDLMNANLERIGWNLAGTRRLNRWLLVDGARHEYTTAEAGTSALWKGVTASRSRLLEGAVSVQLGDLQGTVRGLDSRSGNEHTVGHALTAVWHTRRVQARVTLVRSATDVSGLPDSPGAVSHTSTHATFLESSQPIHGHIVIRQSVNLGSGTPIFEAGGSYEGNRISFSVGHREVFVPFGTQSGFRRVLTLGLRLRIHDSSLSVDTISGGGLPSTYNVSTEGYYGQIAAGDGLTTVARMPQLPKYVVRGRVLNEKKQPVRGAAVSVGTQTVYSDSDGRFMVRMQKKVPMAIVLRPAEFLTPLHYKALSEPVTVMPEEEKSNHPVELSAEISKTPVVVVQPNMTVDEHGEAISGWRRTGRLLKALLHRMVCLHTVPHPDKDS